MASVRALTVLVVADDNAPALAATLDRVYRALTITVEDFRIVIYDDGSAEHTMCKAAEPLLDKYPFVTLRRNERRLGPGYCMVAEIDRVETPFIVYVPGNNTWPLRSYIELFGNIGKADIITSYSTNLWSAMPLPERLLSRAYTMILNGLSMRHAHYYNGLTIYPVDYLRQRPIRTFGFGSHAEALVKAMAAGYSFLEVALPVDTENLRRARTVTVPNMLSAGGTILKLAAELLVMRRTWHFRAASPLTLSHNQGIDELGIAETRPSERNVKAGAKRNDLRIVIAGASSGIGASLARVLAEDGHRLFLCARRTDRLAAIVGNSRHRAYACDIADERQIADVASAIAAETDALDVLINCAGGFGEIGPVAMTDSARWWRTIEVNLRGPYLLIRHLLPLIEKGVSPRIINFAGGGAFSPFPNYSAYACAKTAVVRLTECLADELLPQAVRVNAIAPGFVATDMHQATLAAGERLAGRLQYQRTRAVLEQGGSSMETVIDCVRALISPAMDGLTGKTVSSNFDPWQTQVFRDNVDDITRSDLYTLRRVNVVNLPDGRLRTTLSQPWGEEGSAD